MDKTRLRLAIAASAAIAGTTAALAGTTAQAAPPDGLAAIRAATAQFHDVEAATAAGYVPASPCETSPAGTMGVHYVNLGLMNQPIDLRRPAILTYVPGEDGPELASVEYFKADADQDTATDGDRPSILGQDFQGPMAGHAPGMPIHYDLHVWVWKHNPSGMFAQWNPALSC